MTVYVDDAIHGFGRMIMCHLVSPNIDELHAMVDTIGVQRRWFQDPCTMPKVSHPHYDIAKGKRALAVAAGAVEIDKYQMVAIAKINLWRLHGLADDWKDPLAIFRSKEGRPDHPDLPRIEAWLAEQLRLNPRTKT